MTRRAPILLMLVAVGLGCGVGEGPAKTGDPSSTDPTDPTDPTATSDDGATSLTLHIDPLLDLYFTIRAEAAQVDVAPPPGHEAAVDAAREIQESLGSFGGWGPLDTRLFFATGVDQLLAGFAELPEPYNRRGREISIRAPALRLATALQGLLPGFLENEWPERRAALEARVAYLDAEFMPRHREALAYMMESLAILDPGITVPVFLVTATNPPGAMTYFLHGGAPATVIDVEVGGAADLLLETVLHESCHALDMASRDSASAFAVLRGLLEDRDLTRADDAFHTIPHTLMFVQAEETMRRLFNPDHRAYGDVTDLYERTGVTADVEREVWSRFLDGEQAREAALREIVETLDPRPRK